MKEWRVVVMLALVLATAGPALSAGVEESEALAKQRRQMQHRERRIIYNNDGGDAFSGATPDRLLSRRMKWVLDTQVDSVFYCTGATTMFTHQAKVGETYGEHGGSVDSIRALAGLGTDCLEEVIKFCHENDLEVFFTHRINDIHDSFLDWELSTWKREHPEYLMGTPADLEKYPVVDPRKRWTALDFEIQEVRDYLLAIIDDVLSRYDVDGIEIDYFRNPCFFRPNLTFEPATPGQVAILTGFQRRVREKAYEHGNARGRPILVATRVPMTKAAGLHVGIDVAGWLKDGLLDVLIAGGGYVPFTMPTRELVKLGHEHGVPVYPAISASGMKAPHNTDAHWRGAAANIWQAGADGVYLFNTFPGQPKHPHFTQLGDAEALTRMDKMFVMDNVPIRSGGLVQGIAQSQILPVALDSAGKTRGVVLPVGEDVAAAAEEGRLALAELRIRFQGKLPGDAVAVRLNGEVIEAGEEDAESGWVTYAADPSRWRRGDNALVFGVINRGGGDGKPVVVKSVELRVDYK